jgi:hypothetical protein
MRRFRRRQPSHAPIRRLTALLGRTGACALGRDSRAIWRTSARSHVQYADRQLRRLPDCSNARTSRRIRSASIGGASITARRSLAHSWAYTAGGAAHCARPPSLVPVYQVPRSTVADAGGCCWDATKTLAWKGRHMALVLPVVRLSGCRRATCPDLQMTGNGCRFLSFWC